jgi:hypothetical protein
MLASRRTLALSRRVTAFGGAEFVPIGANWLALGRLAVPGQEAEGRRR